MAIRWRMNPIPTGLAGIGKVEEEQGSTLWDGDLDLASVNYSNGSWDMPVGWYWSCPRNEDLGIEWANNAHNIVKTEKEAKVQARVYVDKCIKEHKKDPNGDIEKLLRAKSLLDSFITCEEIEHTVCDVCGEGYTATSIVDFTEAKKAYKLLNELCN